MTATIDPNRIKELEIREITLNERKLLFIIQWWFSRHYMADGVVCNECLEEIYNAAQICYKGNEVGIG